jgi:hypothetical protein
VRRGGGEGRVRAGVGGAEGVVEARFREGVAWVQSSVYEWECCWCDCAQWSSLCRPTFVIFSNNSKNRVTPGGHSILDL